MPRALKKSQSRRPSEPIRKNLSRVCRYKETTKQYLARLEEKEQRAGINDWLDAVSPPQRPDGVQEPASEDPEVSDVDYDDEGENTEYRTFEEILKEMCKRVGVEEIEEDLESVGVAVKVEVKTEVEPEVKTEVKEEEGTEDLDWNDKSVDIEQEIKRYNMIQGLKEESEKDAELNIKAEHDEGVRVKVEQE